MHTFVIYYGGKWTLARRYGPPQHEHVIEPFAGFAGYSTYWEPAKVTLLDSDPKIIGTWHYLQRVKAAEIMAIPTEFETLDELHICQEAKWLIGWWLNRGVSTPSQQRSNWARSDRYRCQFWEQRVRSRIAAQLPAGGCCGIATALNDPQQSSRRRPCHPHACHGALGHREPYGPQAVARGRAARDDSPAMWRLVRPYLTKRLARL